MRKTDDTLDVAPVMGRVVVAHVVFYVGRDGLDERVIAEGVHFNWCILDGCSGLGVDEVYGVACFQQSLKHFIEPLMLERGC